MTTTLGAAAVAEPATGLETPGAPSAVPATYYNIVGGNDQFWRVEAPARAIGAKVCTMPEEGTNDRPGGYYAVTTPNDDSDLPWRFLVNRNNPDDWEIQFPKHEGTAIWTRPDLARATLAKAMREKLGIRTLAEVDDNYLSKRALNLFLRMGWTDQDRSDHLKALFSQNGVVFSTEWLRDYYWRIARKELGFTKASMPEMFVCRNNIALEDWPEPIPRTNRLRVGWMGSPSHLWDVDLAFQALMHASNLGCETVMIGYAPADPNGSLDLPAEFEEHPRAARKIDQWKKVGYRHVPWVKPEQFRRAALPLDIGLCPLLYNHHTSAKSDVKFLEYAVSGAATIAMNGPVYDTIVHGETGLLVGSPQEMLEAVDLLVRDPGLRERLVKNARAYIREERGLTQMRDEWMTAISG